MRIIPWNTQVKLTFWLATASAIAMAYPITARGTVVIANEQMTPPIRPAKIIEAKQINPTTVELLFENKHRLTLDFYGDRIFRMFQDNQGGIIRNPEATPPAQILVDQPRKKVEGLQIQDNDANIQVRTSAITLLFDREGATFSVIENANQKVVVQSARPIEFEPEQVSIYLTARADEYFYGGGVQNGRFSHKNKIIAIENQNSWTDGGVASPTPFYWSTSGYGMMWHTFKKGRYDFGAKEEGIVKLSHEVGYLDVFIMVEEVPSALLNDFYQLTGHPVLLPKFGFYQGHLNAYNRDYWLEDEKGIVFEDGKRYKESQKDNGGIRESLNGELNNYQFSARAVIDRYKQHDMPLGWILPNDGYGAGYGQTETLDGNIQNLKSFGDYARKNGVEIGLWTQSDLHPKDSISALLQRDIVKEVRDAGVRVLKTDVAWVGPGYSFGLNGVSDVANIMPYYGNNSRPFIISLDGWAGTQRNAGIWSGDQTGGTWEYIRFHIPTYIGSGLSGQPNITSDMDGIFGGKNPTINTRDFQWKTWTPMELNMDGWGLNEKYPHALGEPVSSINRFYLKLKSQLLPYSYSIAKEAVAGLPMIRAMFLTEPNAHTLGTATQYQFLYGPYFLVAPIYQETKADSNGNDIRNGIYLPDGEWVDYFSGQQYTGGRIINNFEAPIWKLPVFVKRGAIIPMNNPNNNVQEIDKNLRIYEIYPGGKSSFVVYDDDGISEAYKTGKGVTTLVRSEAEGTKVHLTIEPAQGDYDGFGKDKVTELRINVTEKPKKITAKVNKQRIRLQEVSSLELFKQTANSIFYNENPDLNQFSTIGSTFVNQKIIKNPQVWIRIGQQDITATDLAVLIDGFRFDPPNADLKNSGALSAPLASVREEHTGAYSLTPSWEKVDNADYYEIEFDSLRYSTIKDTQLLFEGLVPEHYYSFNIRAVNKTGVSAWNTFGATTKANPLEFAIQGIKGETSVENQSGNAISRLFNFDEGDMWHTKWGQRAVPFELVMDLRSVNELDKIEYLPRTDSGNGTLLNGKVYYSTNRENWIEAGAFSWERNGEVKLFQFNGHPTARFIKLAVTQANGGFGSGRELYVFRVPGSQAYLLGDINNDHVIDHNDLTSYSNYTGLRSGDSDFEGYVSNGDINKNGLIDAFDISHVAIELDGGARAEKDEKVSGKILLRPAKADLRTGEELEILVKSEDLRSVNALSFALPYNQQDLQYIGIESVDMQKMTNFTNNRLHTDGKSVLYPTFVNIGNHSTLNGTSVLFKIKFKALRNVHFDVKVRDGLLVDKKLQAVSF